jgi:NAD-dependent dihydropyrimidine dehydrogenase PreA subunit
MTAHVPSGRRRERLADGIRDVLQTAFRLVPWPTEPGLRAVGHPGPLSPVIVTGNYDLTVRRVLRALSGLDAWVVVAPSSGINVWCAASGGHLTTHQVVTALKTSGIAARVRQNRAILPQLAATGVLAREVARRCGWQVRFGPVYAEDLPRYLAGGEQKTDDMRHVRFGLRERLEMAAAWATPTAIVAGGVTALARPAWSLPLVALVGMLALVVFLAYDRLPGPRRVLLGGGALLVSFAAVTLADGGAGALIAAGVASCACTGLLTFDYSGSTPTEGGSHFEESRWHITLDLDRCIGVYSCWQVCPEACFEKREDARQVALAHDERCIRCGACVVQCPQDALFFEDADGRRVEPDVIRRFKLTLLGSRTVDAGGSAA